jgi:hypothetical protein
MQGSSHQNPVPDLKPDIGRPSGLRPDETLGSIFEDGDASNVYFNPRSPGTVQSIAVRTRVDVDIELH